MVALDLLQGDAVLGPGERDQPQVARGHDHGVGHYRRDCVSRPEPVPQAACPSVFLLSPDSSHRLIEGGGVFPVALSFGHPGSGAPLRVGARTAHRGARRDRGSHQFLEVIAIALQERGPLRLAVIGEHHEAVVAGSDLGHVLQVAEAGIDLAEHRERVVPVEPRMVGHFVVAGQGDVAVGGTKKHVLDHPVEAEIPQQLPSCRPASPCT